jgi:hypothetical protein
VGAGRILNRTAERPRDTKYRGSYLKFIERLRFLKGFSGRM